ncbi:MAG: FYDLN acid domain-containing protein [Alphaproteobacteria bacterium]|nr:FYDLN acid domain-containing protein [Alphaproteobacteria bacterium]MCL2504721.1 FYDLN acid domain-containing protein [Alphaproteobacteria bacterium]
MAKAEWGTKRICQHCGKPFYDMKKKQPACPACKTPFDIEGTIKYRSHRYSEKKYVIKKEDYAPDDIETSSDIDDDALIEDVEELADESVDEVLTKPGDKVDN